jgi:hypothetical protein
LRDKQSFDAGQFPIRLEQEARKRYLLLRGRRFSSVTTATNGVDSRGKPLFCALAGGLTAAPGKREKHRA